MIRSPFATRATRTNPKKCGNPSCGKKFTPRPGAQPFEVWCSFECGVALSRIKQTKILKRKNQEDAREYRERKKALKTPQQLWSEECQRAQNAVCLYVRIRDRDDECISCGASVLEVESGPYRVGGYWDGGHYLGKGSHPELRFNTWNISKQCKVCNGGENRYRDGRRSTSVRKGYRAGLVGKIGEDRVAWLEGPHKPLQPSIEYLTRMKRIFNARSRHLKKLRGYE